ncbi:MAG: beta-N-acetylhexosaminidase [Desulfobacterales bacterium]|nr:beta-N-acetylhexosaminidase [Desulfobacterales bacterium]
MIKDRVGQMFMIGFDGCKVSKDLRDMVQLYQIGGVILFSRNYKDPIQLANLCNDLQSLSPDTPLFISIDQEGGRVSRLKEPFTQFPPAGILGQIFEKELGEIKKEGKSCTEFSYGKYKTVELVRNLGRILARELRSVGINMDLAPVLDVNTNPDNPVIGDRSFGAHPFVVSTLGNAFIKGLQENGVIATGKHFPGHGDTELDSHKQLPVVKHNIKRLEGVELKPFIEAIGRGLEAIMTAHVIYPAWDISMPATLSERILKGLLRKKLGFKGLIISDDMEMGAIAQNYPIGEATVNAINAGVDVILIGNNIKKQKKAIQSTLDAIDEGKLPEARIEESIKRIIKVKNKYLLPYHPANYDDVKVLVGCREHKEVVGKILSSPNNCYRTIKI